ncbi:hypothetical protein H7H37_14060, partial [Mycolicibacterium insubricum]|nr:hypothetical protein [Mycolicibacterium insubricum]
FASPGELEEELDAELHHKSRGPWSPPSTASPVSMPSPMARGTDRPRPHWLIVDDAVTAPDAWEGVTGRMGMSGITVLRLAARPASASDSPATTSDSSCTTVCCGTADRSTPSPTSCRSRRPPGM